MDALVGDLRLRHLTELDQKIKTKVSIIFSTHNASAYASTLSLDWLANDDGGGCAEKEGMYGAHRASQRSKEPFSDSSLFSA